MITFCFWFRVFFLIWFSSFLLFAEQRLLRRFVFSVHGDNERAKKLIETSFTMRNNYAHIFLKRDPHSPESRDMFEVT